RSLPLRHPTCPPLLPYTTLFRSAALYKRVTGRDCASDEDRALASWLWRNTHYFHAEEGTEDLWGKGFQGGGDLRSRDYWTGLFSDRKSTRLNSSHSQSSYAGSCL